MYKVFINDSLIILTDSLPKENKLSVFIFETLFIDNFFVKYYCQSNKRNTPPMYRFRTIEGSFL